jgi:O-acetyl-ADP-ribose deacetylase (regulator of RNase III)
MLEYRAGDILQADVEVLVNTVNCVGIMGRGIALQFKQAFPDNFKAYAAACKRKEVQLGHIFVYATAQLTNPRYIVNFPTKQHWRDKSDLVDIKAGLQDLAIFMRKQQIKSIAIPPLGCGLGGLQWVDVKLCIESALCACDNTHILVYEPISVIPEKIQSHHNTPTMTKGRAALVELMRCYLNGLLDPLISLLEVHKLMYFMQEAGEDLRLKYVKGHYGPYAENLRHVLQKIEGHLISGYTNDGDSPDKIIHLLPNAGQEASVFLSQYPSTHAHFARVVDLITGFESSFGLELLSTVHWVIKKESAQTIEDITSHIYAWNSHKQQFTPRQIALAVDVLKNKGWIENN